MRFSKWLTAFEVAGMLGSDPRHVRRLMAAGRILGSRRAEGLGLPRTRARDWVCSAPLRVLVRSVGRPPSWPMEYCVREEPVRYELTGKGREA